MKKILMLVIFAMFFVCSSAIHAEITEIKNVQNVGIYNVDEKISFEITRDNEEPEACVFKIFDIDGNLLAERSFTADENTDVFQLGYFPVGWYRVKVICNGVESNVFASFSVIQKNNAETSNKLSPFSIMHLGRLAYGQDAQYVDALKRLGVGSVRTEEIVDIYKVTRPYEKYNTNLYNAGIDSMATVATNRSEISGANLLDVYDEHKTMVNAYDEKIQAWELINEPDFVKGLSGDAFASWFKASALAVGDAQPEAIKAFGGLANPNASYLDILMQNEIMKYSDTLNVHGHAQDTASGATFQKNRVNIGKIYSAIYADNAPVWNTEAGLLMAVTDNENELPSDDALRRQARYMISSFMQNLETGADKDFWFLSTHYITEGPEYGTFSKNHMPYPAINSLNVLTDNLKEGILLGKVKSDTGVNGYFFDCGDYDAAVVWSTTSEVGSVQLRTDGNALVINLIGNKGIKKYSPITDKVSVDISADPVIIKLSGKADAKDYIKTAVKRNLPDPQTITNPAERIVLQQIWTQKPEVSNGHYRIKGSTEYDVKCRIYNFNNNEVSGSYFFQNTEGIDVSGDLSGSYNISANSYVEKNITVKVSAYAKNYSMENLAFYARTSDGSEIPPSISQMRLFIDEFNSDDWEITVIPEANYFSNSQQGDGYSSQNRLTVTNYQSSWLGGENKVKYESGNIKNSTVPAQVYIYQKNLNVNKDSGGLYFEFTCDKFQSKFESTYFHISVSGSEGSFGFDNLFKFNANTKNKKVYIPWDVFMSSTDNIGITDPSKITTFCFGWHISSAEEISLDFTIKDMGTYKSKYSESTGKLIDIAGVSDSGEYYASRANAIIETYDVDTTEIYVNYEKIDCIDDENGIFNVDFSEYEPGSYSLIVACEDEFNKKSYKEVKFTIIE